MLCVTCRCQHTNLPKNHYGQVQKCLYTYIPQDHIRRCFICPFCPCMIWSLIFFDTCVSVIKHLMETQVCFLRTSALSSNSLVRTGAYLQTQWHLKKQVTKWINSRASRLFSCLQNVITFFSVKEKSAMNLKKCLTYSSTCVSMTYSCLME